MKLKQKTYSIDATIILGLCLATWVLFGRTTGFEFVWDDGLHLHDNPYLTPPSMAHLARIWTTFYEKLYIPVAYTAWGGLRLIAPYIFPGQTETFVFHFSNVFIHMCNGLLVYVLLTRMQLGRLPAAAGAALFLVHPVQVESVAWVSEFRGLLAGLLGFSALLMLMSVRPAGKPKGSFFRPSLTAALSSVLFLGAMLSKPSAISFILFAGIIEYFVFKSSFRNILFLLWPWFLASCCVAVLTAMAQSTTAHYPIWVKPFLWMDAIVFYITKVIFPFPLVASYARTVEYVMAQPWFYLTWIIPAAIGYYCLRVNRSKFFYAAILVFIAGFLPVSGLKEFVFQEQSMVADRYLYLSLFGISMAFARLSGRLEKKYSLVPAAGVLCLFFGVSYFLQVPVWKNSFALWDHSVRHNPRSAQAWNDRGVIRTYRSDYDKAVEDFNTAISLDPSFAMAIRNRALANSMKHDYSGAIQDYTTLINLDSNRAEAFFNRGIAYIKSGAPDRALADFNTAISLKPGSPDLYLNRGNLLFAKKQYDNAVKDYTQVIRLWPEHAAAYNNRSVANYYLGNYAASRSDLEKALGFGGKANQKFVRMLKDKIQE